MRFAVLGPLEVSGEDGRVPLGGPKQRIVLAHLALAANQVVSAECLIDALWGEALPEDPKSTLRVYVSRIRSTLGLDAVEAQAPGYVLKVERDEVDALRFEDLLEQARTDGHESREIDRILREALALWRGPAFADLANEPSLAGEIARLEELRLQAIEEKVAAELELGRHAGVVAELETLTRTHPLRERMWAELMLALYRSGRQGEALAAFDRARAILAEELGIDPSHELRMLHERILRQDPDLELRGEPLRGYRLIEPIGEGAFGIVYRATQPVIGREVAIKAVQPELANHPDFVRRFEREAQIVARLEHPHIVPLYDYWREPDAAYLVMRFLRGGSLEELLKNGPLDPERTASILDQVAAGLSAAHRQGVVHRDVKPGNVLLDEEGNAYLTDFGVALDADSPEKSSGTMMRGTPGYLSPEQVRLDPASPQTDVYALGIVVYEMLTGIHPFPESSLRELLDRHLHDAIPSVRGVRPELPAAVDTVIGRATAKDAKERFSDALEVAAALRAAIEGTPSVAEPVVEIRNPYKGLRAFLEADAGDFFGREGLTQRLLSRLAEGGDASRFLAVVGPSGSGKSSVVRAGLVPALRRGALEGSERWYVIDLLPGSHPLRELESRLLALAIEPPPSLLDMLEGDTFGLVHAAERILPDPDADLVILLDQLEEIFTLVEDEDERLHILECLRVTATAPDSRVRVITTLRADFFDQPLSVRGFGDLLADRTEAITPLSPEELERAIVAPADRAGLVIEPRLIAAMIADVVNRPGTLPLLQYALTELAERREDGILTLAGYRRIGGVSGALARRAEQIHAALNEEAQEACRQLFLRLVTLGEGSEDTRRRVRRSELEPLAQPHVMGGVIDSFGRHRLLSFDRDPVTREPTIEIAHEAMLAAWERPRDWIDEARDDIRTQRRLAFSVAEWEMAERDPSFLITGSRLAQVVAWSETTTLAISDVDRAYLHKSTIAQRVAREHERALERRSVRRARALVAVFAIATLVAASLTIVARNQSTRASREERIARSRELASAAIANIDVDPERSVLLAIAAVKVTRSSDGSVLPEAEEALHEAVSAQRVLVSIPHMNDFDFSPDGTRLVATLYSESGGSPDAAILDARTGERLVTLHGRDEPLWDVDWSPSGDAVATLGFDGTVTVWDPNGGSEIETITSPQSAGWFEFSPDGARIAVSGADGIARVWDVSSGEPVADLPVNVPGGTLGGLAWSPDSQELAVVPNDVGESSVTVWRVDSGRKIWAAPCAACGGDTAWSPDGRTIFTSGPVVDAWEARTGRPLFSLSPPAEVLDLDISSDGRLLAGGAADGTVSVWDISRRGGRDVLTLPSGAATICCVTFSPDGRHLAAGNGGFAAGGAGAIGRIWDVRPEGGGEGPTLRQNGAVAYSPDGSAIAITGTEDSMHGFAVWSAFEPGHELRTLHTPFLTVNSRLAPAQSGAPPNLILAGVDFGPTGSRIAVSGWAGAGIWDLATGRERVRFEGQRRWVQSIDINTEGTRVVTAGGDGTVRLWDATSGEPIRILRHSDRVVWAARFSPDGRLVATAEDEPGGLQLIDVSTGKVVRRLAHSQAFARSVAFSPDGRLVAGGLGDGTIHLWTVSGREIFSVRAHAAAVTSLTFDASSARVATGGEDGLVKIWDARTGALLLTLPGHAGAVDSVAFSPDGTMLASSGADGMTRIWILDVGKLIRVARDGVTRSLTDEECRQYLHVDSCPAL